MAEQLKEHIKDPGSAITHFIGMLMAIFAAIPLLLKAAREPSKIYIIAIAVYAGEKDLCAHGIEGDITDFFLWKLADTYELW